MLISHHFFAIVLKLASHAPAHTAPQPTPIAWIDHVVDTDHKPAVKPGDTSAVDAVLAAAAQR